MDKKDTVNKYQQYSESPEAFRERVWAWLSDGYRGGELGEPIANFVRRLDLKPRKQLSKALTSRIARGLFVFLAISTIGVISKRDSEPQNNIPEFIFDNLESISLGTAGIIFVLEAQDRRKKDHYEAWQVVNSAQGQPGSGGRIYALEDLNKDGVDLQNISLVGANLSGIDLSGANLERADFSNAELVNTKFIGANLSHAVFKNANLKEANFEYSRLNGVDFKGSRLNSTSLKNTILWRADFEDCDLSSINLEGALLDAANLQKANLSFANLKGASLKGAKLNDSILEGTHLQGADLSATYFEGARFVGTDGEEIIICNTPRSGVADMRLIRVDTFKTNWEESKNIPPLIKPQLEKGNSLQDISH